MAWVYGILINLYGVAIRLAALFNPKARQWVEGRKDYFKKLDTIDFAGEWVWFHTASMGEYEQAIPVIKLLKSKKPHLKILVTFFSPSGYEIRKNDPEADYVLYLPLDTSRNAKQFIKAVQPKWVVFVRYEFWPNLMDELFNSKILTAVMAANFRSHQFMFKPWGRFILNRIKRLDKIMVQTQKAKEILLRNDVEKKRISISGNSRIDQVINISKNSPDFEIIESFTRGYTTLILGSCYALEESFVYPLLAKEEGLKIILAPHYIDDDNVNRLLKGLPDRAVRYSQTNKEEVLDFRILVLDTMGMLSSIYKYGDFALIGGGFRDGIHSILEPAANHLPLFYGPHYEAFPEGKDLIDAGGAFEVTDGKDFLEKFLSVYENPEQKKKCSDAIAHYLETQKGATQKIVSELLGLYS